MATYGTKIKRIPNPSFKILSDKDIQVLMKEIVDPFTGLSRVKEIKSILADHYHEKGKLDADKSRTKRINRI